MNDACLHSFNHVAVRSVGMSCLNYNAFTQTVECKGAHVLELWSNSHVHNVPLRRFPEPIHKRKVYGANCFGTLHAKFFWRDEWSFQVNAHDLCTRFMSHCRNNIFDCAYHFLLGGRVHGWVEGSHTVLNKVLGQFEYALCSAIIGAVPFEPMNMSVYKTRRNVCTMHIKYLHIRSKRLLCKSSFAEHFFDASSVDKDGATFHA